MRALLLALLVLVPLSAEAARKKKTSKVKREPPNPLVVGLGKSCKKASDCKSKSHKCIKESDANGKALEVGFCVLPCKSFESGTTKVIPGQPLEAETAKDTKTKKAPPRCPAHFQCRSAGSGVPIDMCVKE